MQYRISHQAPGPEEDGTTTSLDQIGKSNEVFPDDVFEHPKNYGLQHESTLKTISEVKDNPDAMVRVWRAVPQDIDVINQGDWVALSSEYADGESLADGGHVISALARAGDLWSEGLLEEWGYQGAKTLRHDSGQHVRESTRSSFPGDRNAQTTRARALASSSTIGRALPKSQGSGINY